MANSKSNIYPIQLQGAELNLNKLDAEIKQYSGFNKNNSPFVGGCLSNVFHKEEQITGGNAENTYIAENGDVFQVTTEGLFKNGVKVIDYENKEFFDVVEIKGIFPDGISFVYDENNYIYSDNLGKYFVIVDGVFFEYYEGFVYRGFDTYGHYIYKKKIGTDVYTFVLSYDKGLLEPDSLMDCLVKIYKTDSDNNVTFVTYNLQVINNGPTSIVTLPIIKFSGTSLSNFKFAVIPTVNDGGDGVYSFDGETITRLGDLRYATGSSKHSDLLLSNWFCTDKYAYWMGGGSNTSDKFSIRSTYTVDFSGIYQSGSYRIKVTDELLSLQSSHTFSYYTYATDHLLRHEKCIFKKWGVSFGGKLTSSTERLHLGVCDFVHEYGSSQSDDSYTQNLIGGIVNDCVLVNEGVVTGLSLPGGYVLATEWNSLIADYIFFGEDTESWKESNFYVLWKNSINNKWYKLIKSTPKIKNVNNQLVINVNYFDNSYRLSDEKILYFAPAWNNRAVRTTSGFFFSDPNFKYWVATAINEFNLADNASIILNPIQVFQYLGVNMSSVSQVGENLVLPRLIDLYSSEAGATPAEAVYSGSKLLRIVDDYLTDRYVFLNSLKDMPFPMNTDGNVPYSPSLFAETISSFGNDVLIRENNNVYQLSKYDNQPVMSYYLGTLVVGLELIFILQGQYYGIINDQIFAIQFNNGVVTSQTSIVSVKNLQFVGNTPYEALFFSKTNRCLYSFTGANVLNQKQLVDKISEVRNYLYNPATQTVFLITDIGVLFYGLFGMFLLEYTDITNIFLLDNGIVMSDNSGNYRYIKYYLDEGDEGYTKENIRLETCFYGMNNEVVTINDCLYFRLFSEEHEEGDLKVKATTISLTGRETEETTFKIKASDWDKITHTIYLRYQPKTQRGLGVSFSIDSPFKIASMSVGSQPDAVLVDKVSKGAITAPSVTTNNNEW